FVLLAFTVPLRWLPLAALTLTAATMRVEGSPAGLLAAAMECWPWLTASVLLSLLAPGPASFGHWPAYVTAFGAQRMTDEAVNLLRCRVRRTTLLVTDRLTALTVDLALTPIGLSAAVQARSDPGGALALMLGATALTVLASREHGHMRSEAQRALRDPLTGLANRAMFHESAAACAARCKRDGHSAALVLIDLDDFKLINDTWGHGTGDEVLRQFAQRLREATRDVDVPARLGGDEFAVILAEPIERAAAERLAETLRHRLTSAAIVADAGTTHRVESSLGLAMFGAETTLEEALAEADARLYADKRSRKQAAAAATEAYAAVSSRPRSASQNSMRSRAQPRSRPVSSSTLRIL
ncbi:MAG TPA: GGDEF domain-containing protein, partial [Solirubrobacteraceae bacterium]|nr:GGDEF domain-containing protein [Solirubrobacteraceae bacterium]